MEYYPIYIAIKTWCEKRPFLALFIVCLSILTTTLVHFERPTTSISGLTFEESELNHGIKEIIFKFNKDMIKLGAYETNTQQWLELMDLSFDPPQEGSIRTISGDSFSYIFNTPIIQDTTIFYNDSISNITINYQKSDSSPYLLKKITPQIQYATRHSQDLESPITIFANVPMQLSTIQEGLQITNSKGKKSQFRVDYAIDTNKTVNSITCIKTNFNVFNVVPYGIKKHKDYSLIFNYKDNNKENFIFNFSSYASPQWQDLSQNSLLNSEFEVNKSLWILHNTPIKNTDNTTSTLNITPEVPNLKHIVHKQGIEITGDFVSGQRYSLEFIPDDLYDDHNQKITDTFEQTFEMTAQKPSLSQVQGVLYIDRENPIVRYQTVNVTNVTITYKLVNSAYYTALSLYGRSVPVDTFRTNFTINSPQDQLTWQEFNISHLLTNRTMLVLMNIQDAKNPSRETNFTQVIATSSSLTVHTSSEDLLIQANDINTLAPLESMMISIWDPVRGSFQDLGRTQSDGILRVPRPSLPIKTLETPIFIGIFEEREDFNRLAILTSQESYFTGQNSYLHSSTQLFYNDISTSQYITAMISTDRPTYQLGEDVKVHAIARSKTNNNYTTTNTFFETSTQVRVLDPSQKVITNFYKRWSSMGALDFSIDKKLIKELGTYTVQISTPSQKFQTQDYFSVGTITPKNAEIIFKSKGSTYRFGEELDITLTPKFLFGENIETELNYRILGTPIAYSSANYPNYYFGDSSHNSDFIIEGSGFTTTEEPSIAIHEKLKGKGNLKLHLYAKANSSISLENDSIKVYSPVQLGIHNTKTAITNNETLEFKLIAIDPINENIISNLPYSTFTITKDSQLSLGIFSFITNYIPINLQYQQTILHQNITSGNQSINFTPKEEGSYRVNYYTYSKGIKINTSTSFIVISKEQNINARLPLELDKDSYTSGEQALLYIKNPFEYARLLLIVERDTIRDYHTIFTTNDIITQPIVLTYQDEPGLNITAILTSETNMLYGTTSIPMIPVNKELQIVAQMSKSNYLPQEEVTIQLSAYNSFNQAIDGEAMVVIRDRAYLNTTNDSIENPVEYFYNNRKKSFSTWNSLKLSIDNRNITNTNILAHPYQLMRASDYNGLTEVRSNFPSTIYYNGAVSLYRDKKSTVSFNLPDNISSFDVVVLAYDDKQLFGKTNMQFTSSKQLIVDHTLPEFLRPKDQIVWGAYIRNLSQQNLKTSVTLDNQETHLSKEISIPPNSFALVTDKSTVSSTEEWVISAISGEYQDAISKTIPVISYNPKLSSSYSSVLNAHTNIHIDTHNAQEKSLQIQISTAPPVKDKLQTLLEAKTLSLDRITTKLLTFLTYENLIISNSLITNSRTQLRSILQKDIDSLKSYYNNSSRVTTVPNGTFYSENPMYFLSIYEILLLARQNHYNIDSDLLSKLEKISRNLSEQSTYIVHTNITESPKTPEEYSDDSPQTNLITITKVQNPRIQSYALNILATHKIIDRDSFINIHQHIDRTPDSQALILDTMYKLGCSLKNISEQTDRLTRYISETSSEISIQSPSRFITSALIRYYGDYSDGIKILNTQHNDLFSVLTFMEKYNHNQVFKATATINNQEYKLNESTNSINTDISRNSINIALSSSDKLFYNIIYSYVPQKINAPVDSGFTITKKIIDPETKSEPTYLEINKEYSVELTITPKNRNSTQRIEIIDPLYAGTTIIHNNLISDDKVYLYTILYGAPKTVTYKILAKHQGIWTAPPTSVSSLSSAEVFGIQPQTNISIQP